MKTNMRITLYHYDENSGNYTAKHYLSHARTRCESTSYSVGSHSGGSGSVKEQNSCIVRIPTFAKIDVACGDYVYLGTASGKIDKSKCFKVTGFADNRVGANPHWRIECK